MPSIAGAFSFTGDRERLAGARAGEKLSSIRPSSKPSCKGPAGNACEEMMLGKVSDVIRLNLLNRS
jgi:hypothetical protein